MVVTARRSPSRLAFVLGIRPDLIRAALILEEMRRWTEVEVTFVWSGQHYSDNLKGIFLRELEVAPPEIDLNCAGETDADISGTLIARLYPVLERLNPTAAIFLGDTNTTIGAIAAAMLNIPIVHIEGCMRSYDWRMPEEKYRTTIDHLADVIYAYFDEYKEQGIREGLNPRNIVVVGNPIVDILNRFYFSRKHVFDAMADSRFFDSRGIKRSGYYVMTCHRRENVQHPDSLSAILHLVDRASRPVYFPASYRTQKVIRELGYRLPANTIMVDPVGYEEMLCLMVNSIGVITDSGTLVEEACVLQIPSVQLRKSTERPQVYDAGSSVKFDPSAPERYPPDVIIGKLEALAGRTWVHGLGDGRSSQRIAADLHQRILQGDFAGHRPEHSHLPIARSYREDGLA